MSVLILAMRVTRQTRDRTRTGLLGAARALFAEVGFGPATTRAIAERAGVATGTVFNYFPTKEALAAALVRAELEGAWAERDAARRPGESAEEALFALVATELRHLEPCRGWVAEVLEAGSSLLRREGDEGAGGLRVAHLERVVAELRETGRPAPGDLALHLYWTLVLGVLAFWSRDESEHRSATLALLDRSLRLFCRSLDEDPTPED